MPPKKTYLRPNLSVLVLVSFVISFLAARTFTTLYPSIVLINSGYHIHHFWFGLAMLAIGGWIGISYQDERANRIAAIIFGAGGGLIGDEVGLLLTFGDYATSVTYTLVVVFLMLSFVAILLSRYHRVIKLEFTRFLTSNASLYFGVLLAAVSMAFILETGSPVIGSIAGLFTLMGLAIIAAYFIKRLKSGRL